MSGARKNGSRSPGARESLLSGRATLRTVKSSVSTVGAVPWSMFPVPLTAASSPPPVLSLFRVAVPTSPERERAASDGRRHGGGAERLGRDRGQPVGRARPGGSSPHPKHRDSCGSVPETAVSRSPPSRITCNSAGWRGVPGAHRLPRAGFGGGSGRSARRRSTADRRTSLRRSGSRSARRGPLNKGGGGTKPDDAFRRRVPHRIGRGLPHRRPTRSLMVDGHAQSLRHRRSRHAVPESARRAAFAAHGARLTPWTAR